MCWLPKFCFSHTCVHHWSVNLVSHISKISFLLELGIQLCWHSSAGCSVLGVKQTLNHCSVCHLPQTWLNLTAADKRTQGFVVKLPIRSCSLHGATPKHRRKAAGVACCWSPCGLRACVRVRARACVRVFGSSHLGVFQSWNKTLTEILWTGTKEKFHQFALSWRLI